MASVTSHKAPYVPSLTLVASLISYKTVNKMTDEMPEPRNRSERRAQEKADRKKTSRNVRSKKHVDKMVKTMRKNGLVEKFDANGLEEEIRYSMEESEAMGHA